MLLLTASALVHSGVAFAEPVSAPHASAAAANATARVTPEHGRGPVLVASSHIDPSFEAVAEGYAEFIRQQLTRVGVEVRAGAEARSLMVAPGLEQTQAGEAPENRLRPATDDALARARQAGAALAVLVDLRPGRGVVEIDLRAYTLGAQPQLVGGGLGIGTLKTLSATTNPVLLQILPALDPNISVPPLNDALPGVEQLAAASRALRLLDAASLAAAWREVEGLESPFLSAIRAQIQRAAKRADVPFAEQARLLIAQGRASSAWRLVFDRAQRALSSGKADAPLLLAAGEAQLAQGNARGAVAYLAKSVALAPESAEASMSLARAYEAAHRPEDARSHYERAAKLDPTQVGVLEELASLPSTSQSQQAALLFEAGQRAAKNLDVAKLRENLDRAVRLDPSLAPLASEASGELFARVGDHAESLAAFRQAIEESGATATRLRSVARAQHAMRDTQAAEASYLEVLGLDQADVGTLKELGTLYVEAGKTAMAVMQLERAEALAPSSPDVQRTLAGALHARGAKGDLPRARELHEAANRIKWPSAADLQALANVQRDLGDVDGAVVSLERSIRKRDLSMSGREALAEIYGQRGDGQSAARVLSAVRMVSGEPANAETSSEQAAVEVDNFDALLQSFAGAGSAGQRAAFLGLTRGKQWRDVLVNFFHPQAPNLPAIENGILAAIDASHTLVGAPVGAMEAIGSSGADLLRFDSEASRSADLVTFVNLSMDTDAVFVGRVLHPMGSIPAESACGNDSSYVLELRKLAGQSEGQVSLLANRSCVPAAAEAGYSRWNSQALLGWSLLVFLLVRPVLRGWGRVRVVVRAPENGRALFSITVSRRAKKFKEDKKDSAAPAWRFEKRLESARGSGRQLKGNVMVFGFVAARRRPYYVTVRGPLLDLATDKLIGEFLEEKTLRVRRWRTNEIKFDMRTELTAITVKPQFGAAEDVQARVSLRGVPSSLRFTSGGQAYLYAAPGKHVVVVGLNDRVAECPVSVESPAPISLEIDMLDSSGLLFTDCQAAVGPYVDGDFVAAADALAAAGDTATAERIRALHLREKGDAGAAARVLENAGMHEESVELQLDAAAGGEEPASPELLEEGGHFARAGEAFEARGDYEDAARNYERAYEYQRAADCYSEIGDTEKVLCMYEALGDLYEAGKAAAAAGQIDRAIHNLQQLDSRHGFYSEACRLLADLLTQRGELDLAVEKYAEALEIWGRDSAPLEMQQAYGELLEQAQRQQDALTIYEGIRRRDVHFGDVSARIENLKKQLSTPAETGLREGSTIPLASDSQARIGDENSRYEILEELGRGGMGVVYRARDRNLGRAVALKVLPDNLRQHPQAVKLFLREARAAAALNHQNIVTLFDAGQEGEVYFLTMECLEGAGLDSVLAKRGPLPVKAVGTVGLQVAAGLDYAQRSKIVHRDIKPANLFLTRDRTVKIMDFGLAKMVEEVRRGSTVIGGTPNFMAPEQATGGVVDYRTDLYALGGTLFELATGSVPFESGDVAYHHAHTPPPDARERNVNVPQALAELILQMMAKDPAERVQSARELAGRLQAILKA
jgi:tetratricopeptide (TPR) repeat protein